MEPEQTPTGNQPSKQDALGDYSCMDREIGAVIAAGEQLVQEEGGSDM